MPQADQLSHRAPVHLPFNERKATEAALRLLERHGGHMNYMLLIKLLYLADREALNRWGRPITTDCYVAMNQGPVLSRIYDLIKDGIAVGASGEIWTAAISAPEAYEIRINHQRSSEELSEAEEKLLDSVDDHFGNRSVWKLVDWMHVDGNIPEWSNPEGSSAPISYGDILRALGKSNEEIEQIEAELASVAEMDRLSGTC